MNRSGGVCHVSAVRVVSIWSRRVTWRLAEMLKVHSQDAGRDGIEGHLQTRPSLEYTYY